MKIRKFHYIFVAAILFQSFNLLGSVGAVSGSNQFSVSSDGSTTTWKIVSASITGAPVFSGAVNSVTDSNISFVTGVDDTNATTYPFFAAGSFIKSIQVPVITSTTPSSGAIPDDFSSSNISYGSGFRSDLTGFTNAPEIIISPSDGGGTTATATATLTAGEITGITVTDGGTEYTSTPEISVVGGPHFVRIVDENSNHYGRVFLIENNSLTSLKLYFSGSTVVDGETQSASTFFSQGTLIEVVPAATIGSIFGSYTPIAGIVSSDSYNNPSDADWIYLWTGNGYKNYFHVDFTGHRFLSTKSGWYGQGSSALATNTIIYPDEAFIMAKRKNGTVTLDIEVSDSDAPARLFLPSSGDLFVANNPYGMDMLLSELIPSTIIGNNNDQFKAGSSASDTGMDTISILSSVSGWQTYYYKIGDNDSGITDLMSINARAGNGGSNALLSTDLFIDSGTVTGLQSCTDASGGTTVTNYNDGNFTKVSISGSSQSDLTGFKLSFSDLQGYMLSEDGANEMNATTGESVDTNGTGSIVYTNLNGSHEIVGSGVGYVVIEKQRDINFIAGEGSPVWNIGDLGAGYDGDAYWFAIGGGGTGAKGTITTGGSITILAGGSGYTSSPQIISSGGGWRNLTDASAQQGGSVIGSEDGIIINRKHSTGVTALMELPSISD